MMRVMADAAAVAPPSVLPDISRTRGEIGCHPGFRRSLTRILAFLLLSLALASGRLQASAADLPKLTGRVVDNAEMMDPASEAALTQKLADFEKKGSDQIEVATINTLDGEAIEPYANRLFRAWGLGQAGENNGVLLLVVKNDRKMRIEVGYGLEGTLTDLHTKLIIENTMVPAFRAGDFAGGISRAVDDIIMVLEGNAAELEARGARNPQTPQQTFNIDPDTLIFIFWLTLFFGGLALAWLPQIFGERIGPGRYRWLGIDWGGGSSNSSNSSWSSSDSSWSSGSGWSSGSSGGSSWSSSSSSSSSGGFSGGGGSSGGGGASGSW